MQLAVVDGVVDYDLKQEQMRTCAPVPNQGMVNLKTRKEKTRVLKHADVWVRGAQSKFLSLTMCPPDWVDAEDCRVCEATVACPPGEPYCGVRFCPPGLINVERYPLCDSKQVILPAFVAAQQRARTDHSGSLLEFDPHVLKSANDILVTQLDALRSLNQ